LLPGPQRAQRRGGPATPGQAVFDFSFSATEEFFTTPLKESLYENPNFLGFPSPEMSYAQNLKLKKESIRGYTVTVKPDAMSRNFPLLS